MAYLCNTTKKLQKDLNNWKYYFGVRVMSRVRKKGREAHKLTKAQQTQFFPVW